MNKKGIIVYHSKTGFTKRYAEWLSEETLWPLLSLEEAGKAAVSPAEFLVFGSRLHAGSLEGLSKARKVFRESGAGRLVLFATGAMPGTEEGTIADMWKQNLTEEERKRIPHFYLQGGLNYEKMDWGDRMMMRGLSFFLNHRRHKTEKDKAFAEAIAHSYDISSREYLAPILDFLAGTKGEA